MYLRDAASYVRAGTSVNFATFVAAAIERGETAIGYRHTDEALQPSTGGVVVNPPKSATFTVEDGDRLIVLAEE